MSCVFFKCLRFCAISVGIIIILKFLFDRYFSVCDSQGKRESFSTAKEVKQFSVSAFIALCLTHWLRISLLSLLLVRFFVVVRHINSHLVRCVCFFCYSQSKCPDAKIC